MPLLQAGAERCVLQPGTYTLGGRGANALPLPSLESCPEVATIEVPPSGPSTIQRLAASVVVRVDQAPIGIAPKALQDGVEIEFTGNRLTFSADEGDGAASAIAVAEPAHDLAADDTVALQTRIVNMRTDDALDLGDTRVVVGRDESCDVVLSGAGVSRRHFSISPVQGGYLLRDESANGTLVNGSPVSGTYLLGHGDIVRVADEEFRFEVAGAASAAGTAAEPTAVLDVSRVRAEYAAGGMREPARTPLAASLEIERGRFAGASFPIERPVCSIGRGAQSDVLIRDESVSANHATLLRKGASWFVVDLRSANGTFVDGLRIAGERELASGSRLKLGRVELVFRALDSGVAQPSEAAPKRSWLRELFRSLRATTR